MSKEYKIGLVGIDEGANQAIDLACCQKFSFIKKSSILKLNKDIDRDNLIVIVATKIDDYVIDTLLSYIQPQQKPILVIPQTMEHSSELERVFIEEFRVIISSINNLVSISLSNTISLLENFLFIGELNSEITPNQDYIYKVLSPKSINIFRESYGENVIKATLNFVNHLSKRDSIETIHLMYEVDDDINSIPISLEIIESKFLPKRLPIFTIKGSQNRKNVKITGIISKKYNFLFSIQKALNKESGYFSKMSILVDAYRDGKLDEEEIELLSINNGISFDDISLYHQIIYEEPNNLLNLLKILKDNSVENEIKTDMIVSALINKQINENILIELIDIFEIPSDVVIERFKLRENGKLCIRELEVDRNIALKYSNIFFGVNEFNPILVWHDDIMVESNGTLSIDMDNIYSYSANGDSPVWFVSKKIDEHLAREIIDAVAHLV